MQFPVPGLRRRRVWCVRGSRMMMRFATIPVSKALVWMTAALLPLQAAFPSSCGGERSECRHGDMLQSSSLGTSGRHCRCCRNTGASGCCAKSRMTGCTCGGSCANLSSRTTPSGGQCHCFSQESRAPTPAPVDNSRVVKQVVNKINLTTGWLSVAKPRLANAISPGDVAALPLSSLDRLSVLCRFVI